MYDEALVRHEAHFTVRDMQSEGHVEEILRLKGAAFEGERPGREGLLADVFVLDPVQLRPELHNLFTCCHSSDYGVWRRQSPVLRPSIPASIFETQRWKIGSRLSGKARTSALEAVA